MGARDGTSLTASRGRRYRLRRGLPDGRSRALGQTGDRRRPLRRRAGTRQSSGRTPARVEHHVQARRARTTAAGCGLGGCRPALPGAPSLSRSRAGHDGGRARAQAWRQGAGTRPARARRNVGTRQAGRSPVGICGRSTRAAADRRGIVGRQGECRIARRWRSVYGAGRKRHAGDERPKELMDTASLLHKLLAQRILVLDGAMGTMIQRLKLTDEQFRGDRFKNHAKDLKGNSDLLVLTRPDDIAGIHAQYLEAGADIIETNTFTATTISQADYDLESVAYELNVEGARIARRVTDEWTARTPDRPRFVAGSLGPTNRTLSISPDVNNASFRAATFDELRTAYEQQTLGLIDGGSHLLLLETIFDTLNAKAALVGIDDAFEQRGIRLPLMISVTITDRSGRTLSGQTLDAFYVSMEHARPFSIGLNCALGAREIRPYLAELARIATCYVSCYPNAGLPNAFGQYDELPDETAELLREFATSGFVNLIGGCCGTTPGHIRAVATAVDGVTPRPRPADQDTPSHGLSRYSGLETLVLNRDSNFQMIGERTNVTGSKRFARLVLAGDWAAAADVALDQVRGGANILDVNMDEGMLDSEKAMTEFLHYIATEPEIARIPVMIDSSKWSVIQARSEERRVGRECR